MKADNDTIERCVAELLAGSMGLRETLRQLLRAEQERGDRAAAARVATLLLLHTLADFGDFRGMADAMAAFDVQALPPTDALRADAVRLNLPSLHHRFSHDDPTLIPVRDRLFDALRVGMHLPVDERVMLSKLLIDHHSMRNDFALCAHVLALMQDVVAGASLRWQAWWWQLAAEVHLHTGDRALARADLANLQALLPRVESPDILLAHACEDMRQALHVGDLQHAERVFRTIEQLRPRVRPALLPYGLRVQTLLLLRRREYGAALERAQLALQLSRDHERPERDFAGYVELRAYALIGLGLHGEAVAVFESQLATQASGQREVAEVLIALARTVQALDAGSAAGPELAIDALRRAAAIRFHRFLMSLPDWAARITAIGLEAGVETEFLIHVVRERKLAPPDRSSPHWPWALQIEAFGALRVRRDGEPLGGQGGKAQRKPLELLALLAAYPGGIETDRLVDALWPSLEADAPKASLEMAITRLRRWLGLADAVRVADGRVALHAAIVWSDVAAFEQACDVGDAARALALYRAALLPTEPLVADRRERLAARLVSVVLEAAPRLAPASARSLLARALAVEPQHAALRAALGLAAS
jgi:hypothetical protein